MRTYLLIVISFILKGIFIEAFSQVTGPLNIRIMFWNVENFFDPFDDSLTLDDEFTSHGNHGWTWKRFNQKVNSIYKVTASIGWEPPELIGLCEVENRWVLEQLTRKTALSKYEYQIIHQNSPDHRGIDVAILYLPDSFRPLECAFIPVTGLQDDDNPTRDILFVTGILKSRDTLALFVNHWPSRYPGQVETSHKRLAAAKVLKQKTDSLFAAESGWKIIIMGDFNDEPWDQSISEILEVKLPGGEISGVHLSDNELYSLIPVFRKSISGTLKFEGRWYLFDQFIISGGLLNEISSYETVIISHDFLLEPDESYTGQKPFRTYNGYIYNGGYSDHLPICLTLYFK